MDVTTYDDMDGVNVDTFFTYDDPLGNAIITTAFQLGTITRNGPDLTIDWAGSDVLDGLDTPLVRDDFNRVDGASLGSTEYDAHVWTTTSGGWTVDGTAAIEMAAARNVRYTATIADVSSVDFDVSVLSQTFELPLSNRLYTYIIARYQDASNHLQLRLDWNTTRAPMDTNTILGYDLAIIIAGVRTSFAAGTFNNCTFSLGKKIWMRAQGQGSMLRVKMWDAANQQPEEWAVLSTDPSPITGSVGFAALIDSGNTNTLPVKFAFHQFWSGQNRIIDVGQIQISKSLDDGMPSGATDSGNLGVPDGSALVTSPFGTRSDVYFSEFRDDQILHDIGRDIPTLTIRSGVVTDDGVRSRRLFTGQMGSMSIGNESVGLTAISRNRLRLSTLIQPPAIHGVYEGCEATWMIGYALWKSGLLNAPPVIPENGCRLYMPMNGSLRSYWPDTNYLPFQAGVFALPVGKYVRPGFIPGPFPGSAAPYCAVNADDTRRIQNRLTNIQFGPGTHFWSGSASRGRIEVWVLASNIDVANSDVPGLVDSVYIQIRDPTNSRYVALRLSASTYDLSGHVSDGVVSSTICPLGTPIPSDGQWHFLGMSWNLIANTLGLTVDNRPTKFFTIPQDYHNLPFDEDVSEVIITSYLPIAELRMSSGLMAPAEYTEWANRQIWTRDVEMRRSLLHLEGLAETAPREAFSIIQSYAQGELAQTGFGDDDKFRYLPLTWFGEKVQQVPVEALATDTNLGRDFLPVRRVNQIYNQVAVTYKQAFVNENFIKVVDTSALQSIPAGHSEVIFATSASLIEVRNVASGLTVMSGAALAAAPPSEANAINYITVNTVDDGTGTYLNSTQLTVSIVAWTPSSVTLHFFSSFAGETYIANNVNISPMSVAGKVLQTIDASLFAQSDSSIVARGKRTLLVSLPGVSTYLDAMATAREIMLRLCWPRVSFTSSVFGDARRNPGQLVTVSDPDRTTLEGSFRLTGVSVTQDQEDMKQTISAEQAWDVLVWGETAWGESIWGEE